MSAPNPVFDLSGKVAVVTGTRRGIGQGIAQSLETAGALVVPVNRPASGATTSLPHEIEADMAEVTTDSARDLVAEIVNRHGTIDILINNAGIAEPCPFDQVTDEWAMRTLQVDLLAPYALSRAAAQPMVRQGWGRIVTIASLMSYVGGIEHSPYAIAKHAVVGMTRSLSNDVSRHGVNVNAVAPGYIVTDQTEGLRADIAASPQETAVYESRIACGRWGTPADIADPVVFLCSDAARYVTGTVLDVDGGYRAR